MSKTFTGFILLLACLLLVGCNSDNDTHTVKNGTYIMKHKEADGFIIPSVTISDATISFYFDGLSSYWPRGSYSIEEDILTMTTDDNLYIYVFQIDGDNLIFQQEESSLIEMKNSNFGVKVTDKAKFKLEDD